MSDAHKWISKVEDEWAYVIPENEEEEAKYKNRRLSVLGAWAELETLSNAVVVKVAVAMRDVKLLDNGSPVDLNGKYAKTRNISEKKKRKLASKVKELGYNPYVVVLETPNTRPVPMTDAETLEEARTKASEVRREYHTDKEVVELAKEMY